MSCDIRFVQGDSPFPIEIVLSEGGLPLDISGSTVAFYVRRRETDTVIETLNGTLLTGRRLDDGFLDPTITTPGQGGRVSVTPSTTLMDADPGDYEMEVEVNFGDGTLKTAFDRVRFTIRGDL